LPLDPVPGPIPLEVEQVLSADGRVLVYALRWWSPDACFDLLRGTARSSTQATRWSWPRTT